MEKLLMLGATGRGTKELLLEAKSRGIYTIITDNLPPEEAPVKLIADEYWMISTADVDLLEKKCREEGITGIANGISTFNISVTMELCKRLGLPCYATPESWYYTIDKRAFKDLCKRNNVPVAKDYYLSKKPTDEELAQIEFPVVVKAIDLSANRGMSYCYSKEDVVKACEYARSLSASDNVIVEKMMRGREYAAWYVMADGEVSFLSFGAMVSQKGYPGNCYCVTTTCADRKEQFMKEINPYFINALKDAGCKEGLGWVEIMLDDDNHFYALEMGYRMSGEMIALPYIDVLNFNSYKWLIDVAMGQKHTVKDLPVGAYEKAKGIAASYILWSAEGGVISEITGYDKIKSIPGLNIDSRLKVGDRVSPGQYLSVITFSAETCEQMCKIIQSINDSVTIKNEKGDIVIRFVDFDVLYDMEGKV